MSNPARGIDDPCLVVAWRTGKTVHGRKLNIGGDLEQYLRDIVHEANDIAQAAEVLEYRPDGGDLEPGEVLVASRTENIDTALIDELERGIALDLASEPELRTRRLVCYAIVVGSEQARKLYVRRQDPVRLARRRLFSTLMDGPLTEIESPVLSFDDEIDVVIEHDRMLVLNPKGFESLFKDSEVVLAAAPTWIDELGTHVALSDESQEVLLTIVRRNSIQRRKLLAIIESEYAASLTPDRIRNRMISHGLDHLKLMPNGTLELTEESVPTILRLLNEDLYRGDFSEKHFAAGSKRPFGG